MGSYQRSGRRDVDQVGQFSRNQTHRRYPGHVRRRPTTPSTTLRRVSVVGLTPFNLGRDYASKGQIFSDVRSEEVRIAGDLDHLRASPPETAEQQTLALIAIGRSQQLWYGDHLHVLRTRYLAEIRDEVLFVVRRHERVKQNELGNALVDSSECLFLRGHQKHVCLHVLAKRVPKGAGFQRIGIHGKNEGQLALPAGVLVAMVHRGLSTLDLHTACQHETAVRRWVDDAQRQELKALERDKTKPGSRVNHGSRVRVPK